MKKTGQHTQTQMPSRLSSPKAQKHAQNLIVPRHLLEACVRAVEVEVDGDLEAQLRGFVWVMEWWACAQRRNFLGWLKTENEECRPWGFEAAGLETGTVQGIQSASFNPLRLICVIVLDMLKQYWEIGQRMANKVWDCQECHICSHLLQLLAPETQPQGTILSYINWMNSFYAASSWAAMKPTSARTWRLRFTFVRRGTDVMFWFLGKLDINLLFFHNDLFWGT